MPTSNSSLAPALGERYHRIEIVASRLDVAACKPSLFSSITTIAGRCCVINIGKRACRPRYRR
jgi:hypothetical protein